MAEIVAPPRFRVMRLCWGLGIGDGSYYGWRWWIHLGPMLFLVGHKLPDDYHG